MRQLLILVLILSTLSMNAQDRRRHHGDRDGQEKGQFLKDLTPQESANLRTKHMTLDLNLTEAQQKEIYGIQLKQAKNRTAKQKERESQRDKLDEQKPSKEESLKRINARLDHQISHKKDMQRILSKDQFAKWERTSKRAQHKRKIKGHRSKRSR